MSNKATGTTGQEIGQAAMGHLNNAMINATQVGERIVALHQGNLEAGAELSRLSIAFAEQSAKRVQELGRVNIEMANAAFKAAAGATTPADFIAAQFEFMRAFSDGLVTEAARTRAAAAQFSSEVLDAVAHRFSALAAEARSGAPE
ncbi:MAG: phasin family protein [Novosphingobium sp.]